MPTWLYFGTQNPLQSPLGGFLGSLGSLLGRLGGVLEAILSRLRRSWAVLSRLGGVLGRLGRVLEASWAEKGPWFPWDPLGSLGIVAVRRLGFPQLSKMKKLYCR